MLYFIPQAKTLSTSLLAQHGIAALLASPQGRETMRGPTLDGTNTGVPGLIVASGNIPIDQLTFLSGKQVWKKRFGSDVLIGYPTSHRPDSRSLARGKQIRGSSITLSDGNAYTVPLLRSFDPLALDGQFLYSINLDRVLEQDPESGRMVPGDVTPPYAEVWGQALQIGDSLLSQVSSGGLSASLDDGLLDDFVAGAMAINYRLQKPELSILKLLTVETSVRIMQLAIDWPTLEANIKNRLSRLRSGGTDSESGETQRTAESKSTTPPQSPN